MLDSAKKIGLSLTDGNMLTPSKSVTALIDLAGKKYHAIPKGCEACRKQTVHIAEHKIQVKIGADRCY